MSHDALHLWAIDIDSRLAEAPKLYAQLAVDEKRRADRIVREPQRSRFIVGRALLRRLLGAYARAESHEIAFHYGPQGKPAIAQPDACAISFNLAHSTAMAICAVTPGAPVGVDLERINPQRNFDGVAGRFFNPAEVGVLRRLPQDERAEAFYRIWTQKEAYVKAVGGGILSQIEHFDVEAAPDRPMRLLVNRHAPHEAQRWQMIEPPAIAGYAAAAAVEARPWRVHHFLLV